MGALGNVLASHYRTITAHFSNIATLKKLLPYTIGAGMLVSLVCFVTFLLQAGSFLHVVVQLGQMVVSTLVVIAVLRKRLAKWMLPYLGYTLFYVVYTQLVGWSHIFSQREWIEPAPGGKNGKEKAIRDAELVSSIDFNTTLFMLTENAFLLYSFIAWWICYTVYCSLIDPTSTSNTSGPPVHGSNKGLSQISVSFVNDQQRGASQRDSCSSNSGSGGNFDSSPHSDTTSTTKLIDAC